MSGALGINDRRDINFLKYLSTVIPQQSREAQEMRFAGYVSISLVLRSNDERTIEQGMTKARGDSL